MRNPLPFLAGALLGAVRGRRRGLVPVVVLALLLTGCGGNDDKASPPPSGPAKAVVQLRTVTSAGATSSRCPSPDDVPAPAEATSLCDTDGTRYELAPAAWDGTVASATAGIPAGEISWRITAKLGKAGAAALTRLTTAGGQIALVIDGQVLAAPTIHTPITSGQIQITGDFTEASAQALVARLLGR